MIGRRLALVVLALAGCAGCAARADMVTIPGGPYTAGSTPAQRVAAYAAFAATSGATTARDRGWFEREELAHTAQLPSFRIDRTPVTQGAYAAFVATAGAPAPVIDAAAWAAQGFAQDFATEVARFVWQGGQPPAGRADHPVVLVTWREAAAYCAWRGARLPTAAEYEKAAGGAAYPWGDAFEPARLASAVGRRRDTAPVTAHPGGASPYGVLDLAGNVFEWTSTPWAGEGDRVTVKGSAWDDYGGVGRGASAHGRPRGVRHAIIGFRCAADGA